MSVPQFVRKTGLVLVAGSGFTILLSHMAEFLEAPRCPVRDGGDPDLFPPEPLTSSMSQLGVANAVPSFARAWNVECSTCHSAAPYLNEVGRDFKEAGYRFREGDGSIVPEAQQHQKISDQLTLEPTSPLAFRVKSYLAQYDGDVVKTRPLHEVELLANGNVGEQVAYHIELETEDEDAFVPAASGRLTWNPSRAINLFGGYTPLFSVDPYNSMAEGGHRLTVAHKAPLDADYGTGLRLRKASQNVGIYGRVGPLFYVVGGAAPTGSLEGESPSLGFGRLAFELAPGVAFGGLLAGGGTSVEDATGGIADYAVMRAGGDFNAELGDLIIDGLFIAAGDGSSVGDNGWNLAGDLELLYTVHGAHASPVFLPLVRLDWTQAANGGPTALASALGVNSYVLSNVRVGAEADLTLVSDADKGYGVTLLVDSAF